MNQTLSGPDFLDAVSDAELHLGNVINADTYAVQARRWQRDLDRIESLELELATLQAETRQRALPGYGITPSDRRN